ncbi:unnamed protein product, partial [Protopolystoma xenopodis]
TLNPSYNLAVCSSPLSFSGCCSSPSSEFITTPAHYTKQHQQYSSVCRPLLPGDANFSIFSPSPSFSTPQSSSSSTSSTNSMHVSTSSTHPLATSQLVGQNVPSCKTEKFIVTSGYDDALNAPRSSILCGSAFSESSSPDPNGVLDTSKTTTTRLPSTCRLTQTTKSYRTASTFLAASQSMSSPSAPGAITASSTSTGYSASGLRNRATNSSTASLLSDSKPGCMTYAGGINGGNAYYYHGYSSPSNRRASLHQHSNLGSNLGTGGLELGVKIANVQPVPLRRYTASAGLIGIYRLLC